MAAAQQLMTEDEVRHYFILNNGLVRNSEIVTYFRTYLANPAIRDEARAVFKTIVNKLATVKVENGEKFLVLKRQYFSGLDGNGNTSGPPISMSSTHSPSPSVSAAYGSGYGHNPASLTCPPAYQQHRSSGMGVLPGTGLPLSPPQQPFTPFPYQAPPPYISHGGFPPPQQHALQPTPASQQQQPAMHTTYHELSKSQPMLHGSHFSLNSHSSTSFGDPYAASQPQQSQPLYSKTASAAAYTSMSQLIGPGGDYDYGLPPAPSMSQSKNTPPRRLSFSSSPSSTITSPGGGRMIPPPYRPPPPAPSYLTSPTHPAASNKSGLPSFRSPGAPYRQNQHKSSPSRVEPFPAFPYQRSQSVSGISGLPQTPPQQKGSHSASPSSEHQPFFPLVTSPSASTLQSPPPPVPPRTKRSNSFLEKSPVRSSFSSSSTLVMDDVGVGSGNGNKVNSASSSEAESSSNNTHDKENASPPANNSEDGGDGSSVNEAETNSEADQKISVKERMQKFNKISSESDLAPKIPNGNGNSRAKRDNKHDSGDYDTSSLSSYGCYAQTEPKGREWILKAARSDYAGVNKMAQDMPSLVKRKDINGYTSLHWAAKLGNLDMVKLLAGTYNSDVNSKSNGGYTPLHLAAQFSRQEIYDVLVKVYNADPNIRDHSGKKPMQYLVRQDTAVSVDTFKKLKEKRRSTEQQRERDSNSFLRIGSLNVRVKKTTEAFGNFIGKSNSSSNIERILNNKKWGSTESLPETETLEKDEDMMPPPSGSSVPGSAKGKRSKSRKGNSDVSPSQARKSTTGLAKSSRIQESNNSGSDSDTACGFGSGWKG